MQSGSQLKKVQRSAVPLHVISLLRGFPERLICGTNLWVPIRLFAVNFFFLLKRRKNKFSFLVSLI